MKTKSYQRRHGNNSGGQHVTNNNSKTRKLKLKRKFSKKYEFSTTEILTN